MRLSFAMTVNKAQRQTIPNVGVYLPEHVFSHGQLYVALSRATARANIKILALPPNVEEGDEEDEKKDKKQSKKKDKKKSSAKEKKTTPNNEKKKISTRNGTYTKNIVYKEVLTL